MGGPRTPKNPKRGKNLKVINLPRKYEYKEGESRPEYKKYNGWNKLSYSQVTSFLDEQYKGGYIANYFLGLKDSGNIFSDFGSKVGEWWETRDGKDLSDSDLKILQELLPENPTAKYETEIVIDLEPFGLKKTCIQGFVDEEDEPEEKKLIITDCKTGNHKDKADYYASEDYQQTTLYSYCRDLEGYEILKSQVYLLERKGNTDDPTAYSKAGNPLWLRLSGNIKIIETPYSRERAESFLKKVAKVAVEISDYYKVFNKFFVD